jgi:hypothetical protein
MNDNKFRHNVILNLILLHLDMMKTFRFGPLNTSMIIIVENITFRHKYLLDT